MPADILLKIVRTRTERLAGFLRGVPSCAAGPALATGDSRFLRALSAPGRSVIAEVKLGSPRMGDLSRRVDPAALARAYERGGAAALSVVVEPDYFHGSYELLATCAAASDLPVLAKDFVVDRVQLEWAAEAGAAAVLLIASLHTAETLRAWAAAARELGLVPLVETHSAAEIDGLAGADWEVVGINNRDLRTFDVSLDRSVELAERLPPGALRVAESGVRRAADVERLARAGFDAFLIGEALVTASDPVARLRELTGGAQREGTA